MNTKHFSFWIRVVFVGVGPVAIVLSEFVASQSSWAAHIFDAYVIVAVAHIFLFSYKTEKIGALKLELELPHDTGKYRTEDRPLAG